MKKHLLTTLAVAMCTSAALAAKEIKYPDQNSPHWLYLPKKMDPARTYWVVVGVHGADWRNRGANKMAGWADRKDNVIVLAPKFSKTYQNAFPEDQDLLIGLFKKLQKEYKVHPTMFLYGFSGGSQFAHRFVMKQPDYVCGVSSHSGGSWGTGKYGKINPAARHIPFAISCGEKDTGKAWKNAPYNRLDWYKLFRDTIAEQQFFYKGGIWPKVGHRDCPGVWKMTEECFQLATKGMLPGSDLAKKLVEAKRLAEAGEFDAAQRLKTALSRGSVKLPEDSGWHDSKEALAIRKELVTAALAEIDTSAAARRRFSLYKQCVEHLKSDKKPEEKVLLAFMRQCPPVYWQGKPDSKLVTTACNTAAASYIVRLREEKKLTLRAYQMFIPLWDGLEVRDELLKEYDKAASKELDRLLAMRDGAIKQGRLRTFVRKWKVGGAVDKARTALE
jgi:poly(3-hydroxybutyrate) depolymerase